LGHPEAKHFPALRLLLLLPSPRSFGFCDDGGSPPLLFLLFPPEISGALGLDHVHDDDVK